MSLTTSDLLFMVAVFGKPKKISYSSNFKSKCKNPSVSYFRLRRGKRSKALLSHVFSQSEVEKLSQKGATEPAPIGNIKKRVLFNISF